MHIRALIWNVVCAYAVLFCSGDAGAAMTLTQVRAKYPDATCGTNPNINIPGDTRCITKNPNNAEDKAELYFQGEVQLVMVNPNVNEAALTWLRSQKVVVTKSKMGERRALGTGAEKIYYYLVYGATTSESPSLITTSDAGYKKVLDERLGLPESDAQAPEWM